MEISHIRFGCMRKGLERRLGWAGEHGHLIAVLTRQREKVGTDARVSESSVADSEAGNDDFVTEILVGRVLK